MTHDAIWFGPRERPLAGFVHSPPGPVAGGVLICAPFGYESVCAHRTVRRIAERLAELGHVVLRFDYEGTGASSGSGREPDLLERWQDNVQAGIDELRRRGVARPSLLGIRLGAALACAAAVRDTDVGLVALWAPVTSGRRYWRELRAQAAITPDGVVGGGALNVLGHYLPGDVLRSLKAWNPLADLDAALAMLLVQSPGWRDADDSAKELADAGLQPTCLEIGGTSAVFERDAELVDVPVRLVEALSRWLDSHAVPPSTTTALPPGSATRVIDEEGSPVEDELVSVSPFSLHGVLTRPVGERTGTGVVFLNNGVAACSGPGRAWVHFARALAADGVACLRVDFTGIGDSPDPGRRPVSRPRAVPRDAGLQVVAAVDYLRAQGVASVTVVGLCSGAHVAVRTAAYRGRIGNVFAINPPLDYLPDMGVGPWMRRLWGLTAFPMNKKPIWRAAHRLPTWIWTTLDRLGLFPSPARFLRRAAARNTRVHLVFAEGDDGLRDIEVRAARAVDHLVSRGEMSLHVVEGMDHSMFGRVGRAAVLESLREVCGARSAPAFDRHPQG